MRRVLKWVVVLLGSALLLGALLFSLVTAGVIGPPKASPELIEKSVVREPALLERAFALPVARAYGREIHFQKNGSYCGPASLVNVFRSYGESLDSEADVLTGSGKCMLGMCMMGLTLEELAEVSRHHGASKVEILRDLSPAEFKRHLLLSNDVSARYVVNFSRKPIFSEGGGHHSPVGGYLEEEDLVLVFDTNELYRPWLVERERLYAAIDTLDGGKKRGLLRIEK